MDMFDADMEKTIEANRQGTKKSVIAALRRLKSAVPDKSQVGGVYVLTLKVGDIEDIVLRNALEALEAMLSKGE